MKGIPLQAGATKIALDPLSLAKNSSGVVFVVLVLLLVAAVAVWFITVLKLLQLRRWSVAQARFEDDCARAEGAEVLFEMARHHSDAPGARVIATLQRRQNVPAALEGVAKRALVEEQQRASSMLAGLGSIGSAAPFIGLFGTVWGIMDAFLRIGREKSASLPVVAPAIGEALIATAVGLFAAIPAVIAYNTISKKVDDLLNEVEAATQGWVAVISREASNRLTIAPAPVVGALPSLAPAGAWLTPAPSASGVPPTPQPASSFGSGSLPPRPFHSSSTAPTPRPGAVLPPTPRPPPHGSHDSAEPLPLHQLRKPGPPFPGR